MLHDIHKEVTDKIIEQLERGCQPWRKAWDGKSNFDLPINGTTNKPYRGINIPLLWLSGEEQGFECNEWGSFEQWRYKKEMVAKGQKGTPIIFYDTVEKEKDGQVEKVPFIRSSYVFNRCKLQNYKPTEKAEKPLIDRLEHVDRYILNTGAKVYHNGGNRAFYSPVTDDIHLPPRDSFTDTESLYSVTLHELTHWSGKEGRCDRKFGKRFGDQEYAFEELVAELGAAFECAGLEITNAPRDDHASYIENWLEVLKADKKAIFTAASEASKAVGYLDGLQAKFSGLAAANNRDD